jgi:hypothetical protein
MRRFRVFPFEGDDLPFSTVGGVTFAARERARSFDFDETEVLESRSEVYLVSVGQLSDDPGCGLPATYKAIKLPVNLPARSTSAANRGRRYMRDEDGPTRRRKLRKRALEIESLDPAYSNMAAFRSSISAFHCSAVLEGVQTTFMYCVLSPCTRSVRAIIICAFSEHMIGLSTCGPRTTSNAVLG